MDNANAAALVDRLTAHEATIGVIGLGYVGLPLAQALCEVGFKVIGFDVDPDKIEFLTNGTSYIRHIDPAAFVRYIEKGVFEPTTDYGRAGEADALLICVPTPLTKYRDPDLSAVEGTARMLAKTLRPGQLVVLESTTYPGTTKEIVVPILEQGGLKSGIDFFVAFSPEREDPGNPHFTTSTIPKVVGADDDIALNAAMCLYKQVIDTTVPVSSLATAEAVKITENIFRAVNIALVNELKTIFSAMDIDVWEVIEAAKSKPFGYMPFYPGPGLGGHCIPIDPFYLTWKAKEYGMPTRFIELAGEINTAMPGRVVDRLATELSSRFCKSLNGSRVLMIGLAYKKNVDDVRESPGFALLELMEAAGTHVDFHDPYVAVVPMTREHASLAGRKSVAISAEAVSSYDAVLISTDHDNVDYGLIAEAAKLIVDTRNAMAKAGLTGLANLCKA